MLFRSKINQQPTEAEDNAENIEVTVNFTSVEKDLKIKFLNKETGELIKGVGFQVELTDSKNKKTTLTDDNKDGIIYETKMTPGTYEVLCLNVGGFEFPQTTTKVKVKEDVEYKKIDIMDEVKSESDINASLEDTEKKDQIEAVLQDTVEFVASTKTPVSAANNYVKVDKTTIKDPSLTASGRLLGSFMMMSSRDSVSDGNSGGSSEGGTTVSVTGVSINGAPTTAMTIGEEANLSAKVEPDNASNKSVTWSSSDTSIAEVDSAGKVTAKSAGTATITVTTADGGKTATASITVNPASVPEHQPILISLLLQEIQQ